MTKKEQTAAEIVKAARDKNKISARELIANVFDDFYELHGDRVMEDDPAMIGGIALFNGQPIRERRRKNGSPATLAVRHLPVTVKPNG